MSSIEQAYSTFIVKLATWSFFLIDKKTKKFFELKLLIRMLSLKHCLN